jgi:hypothetical protein
MRRLDRFAAAAAFGAAVLAACAPGAARADETPVPARSALDRAFDAARTWAPDAFLVYLENDEPLDAAGGAARWGYLFHSPTRAATRGYSVQGDDIRVAADLAFAFDPPPLPGTWVDSGVAFAAAENDGGREYREKTGGHVASLFLIGGLFHPKNPEAATWAIVYSAADEPSLWVVVDAESGNVIRTWRG